MKSLDAGAYGIICPMVNTREDAQRLVDYTHYAPRGVRSVGPIRGLLYGGSDYLKQANDTIVVFAMIETAQALDNLDAILSVEGLDAVYIGPSDLSLSLGCRPVFDDVDPKRRRRWTTSSSARRRMAYAPVCTTACPRSRKRASRRASTSSP